MPKQMITLIGPDGSGKTTMARRLSSVFGARGRYVYMGSNPAAATHMVPPRRIWIGLKRALGRTVHHAGPPALESRLRPRGSTARALQHLKSLLALTLRVADDLYRLMVAEAWTRCGYVVVLDRHPYADYYMALVEQPGGWLRLGDRIHGALLKHVYPRPGSAVLLDAPARVLHGRKSEGTLESVEARRLQYRAMAKRLPDAVVIDGSRTEDEVWASLLAVTAHILSGRSTPTLGDGMLGPGAPRVA